MALTRRSFFIPIAAVAALLLAYTPTYAQVTTQPVQVRADSVVSYDTEEVDGLSVFFREAGDPANPAIVLLHGFPTSSHMYRDLIPKLADRFHVIAPDYPGFGRSSMPSADEFDYTFDALAEVIEKFLDQREVEQAVFYVQDYGGPIGMRLMASRPERVTGLVVQNANFYPEGVLPLFHEKIGPLWTNRNAETEAPVYELFKLDGTKFQYLHGAGNPTRISPDAWIHAQYGLDRPGNGEIQMDLQADYHTNIESYDAWRALLLEHQPPTLVVWGKGDPLFGVQNVDLLKRDMQDIEAHVLNSGHFALEEYSNFIAERINAFFADRAD